MRPAAATTPPHGDFTANRRLIALSILSVAIGLLCATVAAGLIKLIALFTNLFFFQRLSLADAHPAAAAPHLGPWVVLVPVVGGLLIGVLARYGSEKIRGHGIPEALEAILFGRARMEPKLAVLKPLSSAVAIGSGGPFGAEGPIIMTGGAVGSLIAQLFHLSAAERKTLLVAGAAGGMSATFGSPVAAVLLAVELLLFEWKPRSFVPVALASAAAATLRPALLGAGPLFPMPHLPAMGYGGLATCVALGIACGALSALLTGAVYGAEDLFHRLPIHWMWWPALGGLVVGIGGLIEPRALGVGYDVIGDVLHGHIAQGPALRLILVKAFIWSVALGSGTSGGVLAPLLTMGAATGLLASPWLPASGQGWWPMLGLAGVLGGTMRCPLTAVAFSLELTHQVDGMLPLLITSCAAYAFTVLVMKRSILTEKVARRGYHLTREYAVDPLELIPVGQVMSRQVRTIDATLPVAELPSKCFDRRNGGHQGYPVVDREGRLVGVVTASELLDLPAPEELEGLVVASLLGRDPVVIYPDESCRIAAERMAAEGVGRLPVVVRGDCHKLVGLVTRSDLLKARQQQLEMEEDRDGPIVLPGVEDFRRISGD